MSEQKESGVIITLREIYDSVQKLNDLMKQMANKLSYVEEKSNLIIENERKSEEAHTIAKEALRLATKVNNSINQSENRRFNSKRWVVRTLIASVIPYFISLIIFVVIFLVKIGL